MSGSLGAKPDQGRCLNLRVPKENHSAIHYKQKVLIDFPKPILEKLRLDGFSLFGTCEGKTQQGHRWLTSEWHTKHRTRATSALRFRAYRILKSQTNHV